MDGAVLKEWATKLNKTIPELESEYEKAKQEVKEIFPNLSIEQLEQRALYKLKSNLSRRISGKSFVGVVVSLSNVSDNLSKIRQEQIDYYLKAKEKSQQTGDYTELSKLIGVVVNVEKDAEGSERVIPLWPKKKRDGNPNKKAGSPIEGPEESSKRIVRGIATPAGKKEPKVFVLELSGRAIEQDFHPGKIVSFSAMDRTQPNSPIYQLTSDRAEFVPTEDDYFQQGLSKFGLTGLIERFFSAHIVSWNDINTWISEKRKNPSTDPVPEKYKNLTIIPHAICSQTNFVPNQKGNITIEIVSASNSMEDETLSCKAPKELDKYIDFGPGSQILVIARTWWPPKNDGGREISMIPFIEGVYPYPEWKVPRVRTKKLSEKDIHTELELPKKENSLTKEEQLKKDARDAFLPSDSPVQSSITKSEDPW